MPPKKKGPAQPQPPRIIGRVGTSLKIGIVGIPNVGKSTFFNVLTKSTAAAENYPFCTIEPNESRVPVPDSRFDHLCDVFKPASKVPAYLTVVDIAGLVKGASEGQGLGNEFLANIKDCDAIFHVCRAFEDESIVHTDGDVNPVRDIQVILDELRLKDLQYATARYTEMSKRVQRTNDKNMIFEADTLKKIQTALENNTHLRMMEWDDKEVDVLNKHLFITAKPMLYLINLSKKDFIKKKNKWLIKIKEFLDQSDPFAKVMLFSGALEFELLDMPEDEKQVFLQNNKIESQLDKIIVTGYKALNLMYFFTHGSDEVKAWPVQNGTKAPQAAGKIHSDIENGFIMADVIKYGDFVEHDNSEQAVKAAGKYRQQGRNYIVEDGDMIFFKFNAGAGLTTGKKK